MRKWLGPLMLVGAVAGCQLRFGKDAREIRDLIPGAAAMPAEDWALAAEGTGFGSFENRNLTALLLGASVPSGPPDFEIASTDPAAMASALTRGDLVSVIHGEDIKSFKCKVQKAEADAAAAVELVAAGTVSFEVPGIWKGSVDFAAEKRGGKWVITEFHFPKSDRLLTRTGDGSWKLESICPSNHVVLAVDERGGCHLIEDTGSPGERRGLSKDELGKLLTERAGRAPRDESGLPMLSVEIRADPACEYKHVQDVMVECMKAYIWRVSFSVGGKRLGANLPKDEGIGPVELTDIVEHPVFVHEEIVETPVFVHEEVEVEDYFEPPNAVGAPARRPAEDAISDIPLSGTGVVGSLGVGGGGAACFGFRSGGGKRRAVLKWGGSRRSEAAVDSALQWLARNQEGDGSWAIGRWDGAMSENANVGLTGLATLAFLSAGHTEKTGKHKRVVQRAVTFLISQQQANGAVGLNDGPENGGGYNHAIAGLALAEAYGMAKIDRTGQAAQKAVEYSVNVHQNDYSGWRYAPKMEPDTSVTGWFIMQLKMARVANLNVSPSGFQGAVAWLEKVTDMPGEDVVGGKARYQMGREPTPSMTAVGMLGRQFMGWRRADPLLDGGAAYLMENLPDWGKLGGRDRNTGFYYWYHGTLVMFQMGGDWWKAWNASTRDMLMVHQRRSPEEPELDGSWDPIGWDGEQAGRAYSTTMGALCLEVYYRYLPIYK